MPTPRLTVPFLLFTIVRCWSQVESVLAFPPVEVSGFRAIATIGAVSAASDSEAALGEVLAAQYLSSRGVAQTPQSNRIEDYLRAVAAKLAPGTTQRFTWTIHYDPHPAFKSAFALPGGQIIVGGGVLALMGSEDQLAAVLAHEMMHLDAGQVSGRVAEIGTREHLALSELSRWRWEEFGNSYSDDQELTCDRDGMKLAALAGYSPAGMLRIIENFIAVTKLQFGGPLTVGTAFLDRRVARAREQLSRQGWDSLAAQRTLRLP